MTKPGARLSQWHLIAWSAWKLVLIVSLLDYLEPVMARVGSRTAAVWKSLRTGEKRGFDARVLASFAGWTCGQGACSLKTAVYSIQRNRAMSVQRVSSSKSPSKRIPCTMTQCGQSILLWFSLNSSLFLSTRMRGWLVAVRSSGIPRLFRHCHSQPRQLFNMHWMYNKNLPAQQEPPLISNFQLHYVDSTVLPS